jgi:hypothetical protein
VPFFLWLGVSVICWWVGGLTDVVFMVAFSELEQEQTETMEAVISPESVRGETVISVSLSKANLRLGV